MIDIYSIKIGDTITPEMGIKLADRLGLAHYAHRIKSNPGGYKDFVFDGCSGVPDKLMTQLTWRLWADIVYKCCLPHDIGYAYGRRGDKMERKIVDFFFERNLITKASVHPALAKLFFLLVRIGGTEKLGLAFSWGFANV